MSIYQLRSKRPIDTAVRPHGGTSAPARPLLHAQVSAEEWSERRKAKPVNYLLPVSIDWLASLPIDVRPRALVRQYPRIANLVALQWDNAVACRAYFDDLLTDHRGTRKGFPADVHRELMALRNFYYKLRLTLQE